MTSNADPALAALAAALAPAVRGAVEGERPQTRRAQLLSVFERLRAADAPKAAVEAAVAVVVPAVMAEYRDRWNGLVGPMLEQLGFPYQGAGELGPGAPRLAEDFLGEHMYLAAGRDWIDTATVLASGHLRKAYVQARNQGTSLATNYVAEWCSVGARNAYLSQLRAILELPGELDALVDALVAGDAALTEQAASLRERAGGDLASVVTGRLAERLWLDYHRASKAGVPYQAAVSVLAAAAASLDGGT